MLKHYRASVTKSGLILITGEGQQPFVRLHLDQEDTIALLQTIYDRRDILLAGVLPSFRVTDFTLPCPHCERRVEIEPHGLNWQGWCECKGHFTLDAKGVLIPFPQLAREGEDDEG